MDYKVPLYDKIVSERELARKERIGKAAIESLNLAMMPPRMELYYRQLQKASKIPKPKPKTKKFKAKAVPDFRRLQADFQSTLDACKQSFNPTKPEHFAFNETSLLSTTSNSLTKKLTPIKMGPAFQGKKI
ncbi:unnamed protein product [Blepharisma stoltei]|uniref:Uncharacterized protein n=1 Tax=Blepharisma stoltei TaxID=1481888 RepID=A0AAU9JL23_9CILI|nr:unnamed protein product [Blepharisma stoltei]